MTFKHFKDGVKELNVKDITSISMDGPNVNWAFLTKFQADLDVHHPGLSYCHLDRVGLHLVNGAFQTRQKKTEWYINKLLRATYWQFKGVPACHAKFTEMNSESHFQMKYCQIRWTENSGVAQRAIEDVVTFVPLTSPFRKQK